MTNVIAFPGSKRKTPPQTMEELLESVEETRREHIEYLIDDILPFVFQRCLDEGFDLGTDDCLKSTALLVESFRAALYNTAGIEHNLHSVAEQCFKLEEVEPETTEDSAE